VSVGEYLRMFQRSLLHPPSVSE